MKTPMKNKLLLLSILFALSLSLVFSGPLLSSVQSAVAMNYKDTTTDQTDVLDKADEMTTTPNFELATDSYYVQSYTATYGSITDFANMQSSSSDYATLREGSTDYTTLEYRTNWVSPSWPPTGWTEVTDENGNQDFYWYTSNPKEGSNYAGVVGGNNEYTSGILRSPTYNMFNVDKFRYSVYLLDDRAHTLANMKVFFRDSGGNWDYMFDIDDCGSPDAHGWRYKELIVTDSQYLYNGFQVEYKAEKAIWDGVQGDFLGVDCHKIESGTTYRLTIDFDFSGIDYNSYSIERVYIDFQSVGESVNVYAWSEIDEMWGLLGTQSSSGLAHWDIGFYLTSSTFKLRLVDTITGSDSTRSMWQISQMYVYVDDHIPSNYQAPTSDSLYDTDNIYAEKSPHGMYAFITTYHRDLDGYHDIDACYIQGYKGSTTYWKLKYDRLSHQWSVVSGGTYVSISTGTESSSVNDLQVTWHILFKWEHPDVTDLDIKVGTQDSSTTKYTNFDMNWDVETRIEFISHQLSDDRANVGSDLTASGDIRYLNSPNNVAPSPDYVDVRIIRVNHPSGTTSWTYNPASDGTFSNGVQLQDWVGEQEFRFEVVDTTGANITSGKFVSYSIGDRIMVDSLTSDDYRTNINQAVTISTHLVYESNLENVTTGTVSINGISATHQGNGVWTITYTKSTVSAVTFDSVSASDTTYGISVVNQNSKSATVIWDQIRVNSIETADTRVDVGASVNIDVNLTYAHDNTPLTDGVATLSGLTLSHQGNGIWRMIVISLSVDKIRYETVHCSGNSYGITSINQNGRFLEIIWDQIRVNNYTVADARVNINTAVQIDVDLSYAYDDTSVTDGSVTINGYAATHQSGGTWRITVSSSSVTMIDFNNVATSGNAYGITAVDQNGKHQQVIWDQVTVRSYSVTDSRVNIGYSVTVRVTLEYEYDDTNVTDGFVTINGISATHVDSSGVWQIMVSESSVQAKIYNTVACSLNAYDITSVNQNGQSVQVIWDALIVSITDPTDQRINIGDTATGITASAVYAYDSTAYDGTLSLNSTTFMYTTVGKRGYTVISASGDSYGITTIQSNDDTYCIWDGLIVSITDPADQRINIGDTVTGITASAIYAYDGAAYDGTLSLNSTVFTYSTVGKRAYTVGSASGDSYGITAIQTNDVTYCIWDALIISITDPADQRINIGETATGITASAVYVYDNAIYSGTLTLNSTTFTYNSVGKHGYTVSSASGDSYGITAIQTNDVTYCIWDALIISMAGPSDQRINVGETASGITASAVYAYDGHSYYGTLTLNSTTFTYGSVGRYGYTVTSASGDAVFGITVIQTNDATYCIWDALIISITDPADQRINIGETVIGITASAIYAYDNGNYDGSLTLNSTTFTYNSVGKHGYTVSGASGDSYGITAIQSNDETYCIWDALIISMAGPSDQRINVGETASGIAASAVYAYDGHSYYGTLTLNSTTFTYNSVGKHGYTVASASDDAVFGITAIQTNDETYCIWDAIEIFDLSAPSLVRINTAFDVWFHARLVYDGQTLGSGDTAILDDLSATWNGSYFIVETSLDTVGPHTFYVNSTTETSYDIDHMMNSPSIVVDASEGSTINEVTSSFTAHDGIYQGVTRTDPLTIQWDHINDPTPPVFTFNITGKYLKNWTVTSSWSGLIVKSGVTDGEFDCSIESGLGGNLGEYTYTIKVLDLTGLIDTYVVHVVIVDYTVPTSNHPADVTYELGTTGNEVSWDLADEHPGNYRVYIDSVAGSWTSWSNGLCNVSIDGLALGTHNITIEARDVSDNSVIDTVFVTVQDTTAPTINSPADLSYELGSTGNTITWTASDLAPDTYRITIDGTHGNWLSWTSGNIVVNVDGLAVGSHTYIIDVRDTSGNTASDTVVVTVVDTTAPKVSHPPDVNMTVGDIGRTIIWNCTDLDPANYTVTLDGTPVKSGTWNASSQISVSLDGLSVGTHTYSILLADHSGNLAEDSVTVTVNEQPITTTTPPPTTTTTGGGTTSNITSYTVPFNGGILIIVVIVIATSAGIIVVVVVLFRKRAGP